MKPSHKILLCAFAFAGVGSYSFAVADHPSLLGLSGLISMLISFGLGMVGGCESAFEKHNL